MKASEVIARLREYNMHDTYSNSLTTSRVDETKTKYQMLVSWLRLFEAYPDMRVGSIILYNINRDFNCL
jgi:hypothetical protein